jgi:hypothetical protein
VNAIDREVVELLHDRPDLLAVADAVATTQERRRLPRFVLAPAAAVAAAVVLLLVAPWEGHSPGFVDRASFVDRALAAVGSGPVIHAVLEYSSRRSVVVNLATGEERVRVARVEVWYSEQRREFRSRISTDGGPASDYVGHVTNFLTRPDAALTEFATGYRAALEEGRVHAVGDVEVDGRKAKRIEFAPQTGGGVETVTVDAETFVPLTFYMTLPGGYRTTVQHVLSIESVPYGASDFKPHDSVPVPVSGHIGATSDVSLADAAQALGGALLVLDRAPDSVKVSHPNLELSNGEKLTGVLVQLAYGDVEVWLATDRGGAFFANVGLPEPEGSMALGSQGLHGWRGKLSKDGFAVGIEAPTKAQVLAAARALKPLG